MKPFEQRKHKDEFDSKILDLARVTKVTGGGKKLRFRAAVVVGDKSGRVGVGVEKGKDVQQAVEKATRRAKKNLIRIPFLKETIPHEIEAKYGPARVLLRPQIKGRGVVAGGVVRIICNLAGIKNISSKLISRSRNKINIAMATIKALQALRSQASNFLDSQSQKISSEPFSAPMGIEAEAGKQSLKFKT